MSTIRRRLITAASQISKWLSREACNTIKDAFGGDGKAVIKATDAYLDGLDVSKAQNLVEFINEDPMMVCSLGLQPQGVTMPIRWLVGDGNSYCDSLVKSTPDTIGECRVLYNENNSIRFDLFGARTSNDPSDDKYTFYVSYNYEFSEFTRLRGYNGSQSSNGLILNSGVYSVRLAPNVFRFNDIDYQTGTNAGSEYNLYVMGVRYSDTAFGAGMLGQGMDSCKLYNTTGGDLHLVPHITSSVDGMLDLINLEVYPNQGSGHFTDAYTLQDGVTPWTPSTT